MTLHTRFFIFAIACCMCSAVYSQPIFAVKPEIAIPKELVEHKRIQGLECFEIIGNKYALCEGIP